MLDINIGKIEIKISMVLYRHSALSVYHEKCRHSDGLIYYVKGGHRIDFDSFSIRTEKGNLLYLPCFETYSNELTDKHTEYYQIDFQLYENGKPIRLFDKARIFSDETAEKALPIMRRIYDTYADGESGASLYCISDIIRIIGMVKNEENAKEETKSGIDKIRKSISHIREHYYLNTSCRELAAMSNMCVSNLEKSFKKHFGMSPTAYRNKLRIDHAKRLLSGGYSISETAQMTGFSDYFYFTRVFKRFTGCTPGDFKKSGISI